ncbi:YhdT family protein [Planococcus beijingensis]|uniref:YhdT family protein n=1 Tax=Planococcus beijingensis TaxID=2782551 RepID=UPI00193BCC7E|nr:YhdT family protein [Planococcus beijingensis]
MEETDWRFKVAHREAKIGVSLALFNFVWWFGFAYGMGSRPVEEYSYVFGLPDWFFYSCVVGFLVIAVLVIVIVKFFFTDVPFEEEEDLQ